MIDTNKQLKDWTYKELQGYLLFKFTENLLSGTSLTENIKYVIEMAVRWRFEQNND